MLRLLTLLSAGKCHVDLRLFHSPSSPLLFKLTDIFCGEPLKRRKRVDPGMIAAREAKRRRKIEKEIRRLKKSTKKLKPIDEIEGDRTLKKEAESRQREVSPITQNEMVATRELMKKWSITRKRAWEWDLRQFSAYEESQNAALEELRKEDESLYFSALELDDNLLSLTFDGPVVTPPVVGYEPPDGDFVDTTKTFR